MSELEMHVVEWEGVDASGERIHSKGCAWDFVGDCLTASRPGSVLYRHVLSPEMRMECGGLRAAAGAESTGFRSLARVCPRKHPRKARALGLQEAAELMEA